MNLLATSFLDDRPLRRALIATAESRVVALGDRRFAPEVFDVQLTDARLCRLSAVPGELESSLTRHLCEEYRRRGWTAQREISVQVRFEPSVENSAGFVIAVR